MPIFTIQSPDGREIDIEAPDQATAVSGAQSWAKANPVRKPTSQALGFYKGLMKPLDNAAMALEAGARSLGVPTDRINNVFSSPSAAEATDNRANQIAASDRRPGAIGEFAGNMVGTIPAAMATKNPFIAGGTQGALLTNQRDPVGVGMDAATGAVVNWGAGKALDAVSDAIQPVIDPAVRRLKEAGVSLTPGMVRGGKAMAREDKLTSRPVVGDRIAADRRGAVETLNTATVNRALAPLGVKVPEGVRPGHDAIAFAKQTLREAYDDIIPRMSVKIDGKAFAGKLYPSAASLEGPQRKQFLSLLNQHLKTGNLTGQKLKDAHGELRRLAAEYGRDQAAANRELGRVLFEASDELMGAMIAQNPTRAPALIKTNEAYRGYKIAAGAAKGADEGIFSTGQLKQSVVRNDRSKDKDAAARGVAFMQDLSEDARRVIPSRTGDSGTAGRLQQGNIFATVRGVADDVGYQTSRAYQRLRLAPRPKAAAPLAKGVKRLKAPVGAAAVATTQQR